MDSYVYGCYLTYIQYYHEQSTFVLKSIMLL